MLRVLLALLLLANLAFYAWTQGWLMPLVEAPRIGLREPARLAAQVRPELVTVAPVKGAASAAAAAAAREAEPPVCLEAGPFGDGTVTAAEAALQQAGLPEGSWTHERVAKPSSWAVYMGRFADAEVMRSKAAELKRLNIAFDEINAPPLLAPGLRLSVHRDKAAAEAALEQLTGKGVRTARVVELSVGETQHWLRAPQADPDLRDQLKALPASSMAGGFQACGRSGL